MSGRSLASPRWWRADSAACSLIYANVLLRKDPSWFVHDALADGVLEGWPVTYSDLERHYDQVEQMLKPVPYPLAEQTPKTRAFRAAAEREDPDWSLPPLAITFANEGGEAGTGEQIPGSEDNLHEMPRFTCRLVGECDIGCNLGSKNTLASPTSWRPSAWGPSCAPAAKSDHSSPRPGAGTAWATQPLLPAARPEANLRLLRLLAPGLRRLSMVG
jgi:choline dehydrogenase-like flavoprotein